jgi:sporulation protein YlmC with PRC-barrel domain
MIKALHDVGARPLRIAVALAGAALLLAAPVFAQTVTQAPLQQQSAAPASAMTAGNVLRASRIVGMKVVNERNEPLGKIDDLVIAQGRINAPKIVLGSGNAGNDDVVVVLAAGGFLGLDTKLVAVRYDSLRPSPDGKFFVLSGVTTDAIKAAPAFKYPR